MKYYTLNITKALVREGETAYSANPDDIVRYALDDCYTSRDIWREQCFLIFINGQRQIEGHFLLGTGGFDSVVMDKRLACLAMLGANAKYAVLVHNHPGGNPRPGASDIKQTEEIKKAFSAIGCQLFDHVILGEDTCYSFMEETVKPFPRKTN